MLAIIEMFIVHVLGREVMLGMILCKHKNITSSIHTVTKTVFMY